MPSLNVYKNRTNVITVNLGVDVSSDTIVSEIRAGKSNASDLLATWEVEFVTDGVDGMLVFRIDDSELDAIIAKRGYMDIKRVAAGEPYPVLKYPIRVMFRDTVTE